MESNSKMRFYKNLILIGTSHISKESINKVQTAIEDYEPDAVAIELDKNRLQSLLSEKRSFGLKELKLMGMKGFLLNLIGYYIENKLGNLVGVKPGSEMLTAVKCARKIRADLLLIDQDVRTTLNRLVKELTWREKIRFIWDVLKGIITRKPQIEPFDLSKVPSEEIIRKMIRYVRIRYPSLYKVLIVERNEYMAKNLYKLMPKYNQLIAVVGAGHEKEIIDLIKKNENKF